jgi:hypothetical protein
MFREVFRNRLEWQAISTSNRMAETMTDLTNPKIIVIKGFLFLFPGLFASGILLARHPDFAVAALLCVTVWAFCRFYYFAFYVIQHYVDSQYRFAGLISFARYAMARRTVGPKDES